MTMAAQMLSGRPAPLRSAASARLRCDVHSSVVSPLSHSSRPFNYQELSNLDSCFFFSYFGFWMAFLLVGDFNEADGDPP